MNGDLKKKIQEVWNLGGEKIFLEKCYQQIEYTDRFWALLSLGNTKRSMYEYSPYDFFIVKWPVEIEDNLILMLETQVMISKVVPLFLINNLFELKDNQPLRLCIGMENSNDHGYSSMQRFFTDEIRDELIKMGYIYLNAEDAFSKMENTIEGKDSETTVYGVFFSHLYDLDPEERGEKWNKVKNTPEISKIIQELQVQFLKRAEEFYQLMRG